MHTFYRAVCDEHKEMCEVLATTTFHLHPNWYNSRGREIAEWLDKHYGCNLRLIRRDDELDVAYENCYTNISREW